VLNLLVVVALFVFVACYALQAPGQWDDTSYHLPYAQYYLDHKSLQVNEYLRFPLFPNHMDILFSFGLLYGGVLIAQAMATLPLFVIAIGLIGATRQFFDSSMAGLIAFCVFFTFHPLIYGLGYAYIDNGLALYCWAALLVLICIFLRVTVMETAQRIDEWTQTLTSRPGYTLYQHANGLDQALGHRVLQLGFEHGIYFYHGVVIGDAYGIARSSQFASCKVNVQIDKCKANSDLMMCQVKCPMIAPDLMVQKWRPLIAKFC
jgi:hypothetical protein